MRKLLIVFALLSATITAKAQEWVKAAESEEFTYYVNTTTRQRGDNYIVFEKYVPKNVYSERSRLVELFQDSKWNRYSYDIKTLLVDIDLYRSKIINVVYYDVNGNVIKSYDTEDDKWSYAKPNTVHEAICETIEYIIKKK